MPDPSEARKTRSEKDENPEKEDKCQSASVESNSAPEENPTPSTKIQRLIQWLLWKHAVLDEDIADNEKEMFELLDEKAALSDEMEDWPKKLLAFKQMDTQTESDPSPSEDLSPGPSPGPNEQQSETRDAVAGASSSDGVPDISKYVSTDSVGTLAEPIPSDPGLSMETLTETERCVSMMHTKEKPMPNMYLFKFHANLSYHAENQGERPSLTNVLISHFFAIKFKESGLDLDKDQPWKSLPQSLFKVVVDSIQAGVICQQPRSVSPEIRQGLETFGPGNHVQTYRVDVSDATGTIIPLVMALKADEMALYITGNQIRCVLVHQGWLVILDSQRHTQKNSGSTKYFGSYLFIAKREPRVIGQLFESVSSFSDVKLKRGQFGIFRV